MTRGSVDLDDSVHRVCVGWLANVQVAGAQRGRDSADPRRDVGVRSGRSQQSTRRLPVRLRRRQLAPGRSTHCSALARCKVK